MTELLNAERSFYAAVFGIGLLTCVYAMLNGSVRLGQHHNLVKAPPAGFNTPVVGGALFAFGGVGYLVAVYAHFATIYTAGIAVVAAAGWWIGMTALMANWALKGPIIDPHEELEELQGTIATVTKPIVPGVPGEIDYVFRGERLHVAACGVDGTSDVAGVGTEVVIEKIENGVAHVELWSVVEQRL
jgi:hypothetical protein